MHHNKQTLNFTYFLYNSILIPKFLEVTIKEFVKYVLLSNDPQKKRYFCERIGILPKRFLSSRKTRWIWIHANSIGEVNASEALIRKLKDYYNANSILLTTSNFSADKRASQLKIADAILFFPFDISFIIKYFLKVFNPICIIIVECDIWPNFIKICRNKHIPVLIVSGICTNSGVRSLDLRYFYNYKFNLNQEALKNIEQFCMQTEEDAKRIQYMLPDHNNISVTGNLKFIYSSAMSSKQEKNIFQKILNIKDNDFVFVAGNIHKEEYEIILEVFKMLREKIPEVLMILAPRFMKDISCAESLLIKRGFSYVKRTQLDMHSRQSEVVILLDTMGELAKVYRLGKVAFVGGSLVYLGDMFGGHNILEPAACGIPVLFGPYMHNFQNLADLFCKRQAGVQVRDAKELTNGIEKFFTDAAEAQKVTSNAMRIFEENKDVSEKTFLHIDEKLKGSQNS